MNRLKITLAALLLAAVTGLLTGCDPRTTAAEPVDNGSLVVNSPNATADLPKAIEGLGSLLDGWTIEDHWGLDDFYVGLILQSHGAKEATAGQVPDIKLNRTTKDGRSVLWLQYRGRNRYIPVTYGTPAGDADTLLTKAIVDMAQIRLQEYRKQIDAKLGLATKAP